MVFYEALLALVTPFTLAIVASMTLLGVWTHKVDKREYRKTQEVSRPYDWDKDGL